MQIRLFKNLTWSLLATATGIAPGYAAAAADLSGKSLLDLDLETLMQEEIVVTANKRRENLQRVPISMSVFNAETLEKRGLDSFQDLATGIPALSFRSSGPGRQTLTLRGLSSSAGSSPTISFYIDETPIPPLSSTSTTSFQHAAVDPALFDLERIEILRGPQGTLYGSSSMGGTVRLLTKQPALGTSERSVTASLSSTEHGGINWHGASVLNVPLAENAALRVSSTYAADHGFIDRVVGDFSGPNRSAVGATHTQEDVDGSTNASLRMALQLQPTQGTYLRPSLNFNRLRQDGRSYFDRPPGELQQRVSLALAEPYEDDFRLYGLTAGAQLAGLSLTSISSYTERDMSIAQNEADSFFYSFGNGPLVDPSTGRRTRDPISPEWQTSVYPVVDRDTQHVRDFTQELRLTSSIDSSLRYLTGAFFKDTRATGRVHEDLIGYTASFPLYTEMVGTDFGDNFYTFETRARHREYALFGELSYSLTPRTEVTLGARWYRYRQQLTTTGNGFFVNTPVPVTTELPTAEESGINPRLIVSHALTEDSHIYAGASKGSRPGGLNSHGGDTQCVTDLAPLGRGEVPTPYDADSLWSYEIGSKNQFFSHRLTVNAAAYVIDWSDVQQRISLPNCGFTFIDNAGEARSQGMELEVEALASEHLRLGLGAGYADAKITRSPAGTSVLGGQRLLDAPEWTGNLWGEYNFTLRAGLGGFVRADWSYSGAAVENFENGRIPGTRPDPYGSWRDSHDLANLKLGLVGGRWNAALYVHNMFDERIEYTRSDSLGILYDAVRQVVTNRPRTVGVAATIKF